MIEKEDTLMNIVYQIMMRLYLTSDKSVSDFFDNVIKVDISLKQVIKNSSKLDYFRIILSPK